MGRGHKDGGGEIHTKNKNISVDLEEKMRRKKLLFVQIWQNMLLFY